MNWCARAVCGLFIALCTFFAMGAGVASADALVGKTYADAASAIAGWKGTPVVATVNGSQLAMDDCIVVNWHKSIFLDSSGRNSRAGEFVLSLDCNRLIAGPGHPGNSAMSTEGRQAKDDEQSASGINKNPAICEASAAAGRWCARICDKTKLCEYQVA